MGNPVIDKNKLFELLEYKPHPHQAEIHESDARFLVPCCGRRFGKSIAAGHEITWRAMVPDRYIWIVGPTYKLGEKEFRVVYDDFVVKLPKAGYRLKNMRKSYAVTQGNMRIALPWNTVVEVVSAEKQDSLVGEGLDFVCMSEAALHNQTTWDMYIRPALSDKRGGAIFPSTPRGNNWYKGAYQLGQDPSEGNDWQSWRFPTWFNTVRYPNGLDEAELIDIRKKVSSYFWDQEYAALFTAREGRIYKEWDENIHVISNYTYNPQWVNWNAFDFGFSNPFVCLDIQIDPATDDVYVWREYQERYKTTWEHAEILKHRENPENYRVTCAAGDPRGPDAIATLQFLLNIPILANPFEQSVGHEAVARWLKVQESTKKPKLFISRNCPELIRQMEQLETETFKDGVNQKEGQRKVDDHGPDALRYFFNEWEVNGGRYGLGDVYDGGYGGSEAEGFFIANQPFTMTGAGNYDNLGY